MSKHGGKNFNPNANSSNTNNSSSGGEHDVSKASLKMLDDEVTNSSSQNYDDEDLDEEENSDDEDEQSRDEEQDDEKEPVVTKDEIKKDIDELIDAKKNETADKDARNVQSAIYITPPSLSETNLGGYSNSEFMHSKENVPRSDMGVYTVSPVVNPNQQVNQMEGGGQANWPFYPVNRVSTFGGYSNDLIKQQPSMSQPQVMPYHQPQPSQPQYASNCSSFYNFNMTPLSASSPSPASIKFNSMSNVPVSHGNDFNSYMYQQSYMTPSGPAQSSAYAPSYGNFYSQPQAAAQTAWNMNV